MTQRSTLREIPGIGAAVEEGLRRRGIRTPADLADAAPERVLAALAGLRGLSAARVARWQAAAADLAGRPATDPTEAQNESFTVSLRVDAGGSAEHVRVVHVRSGTSREWSTWEPAAVVAYVEQAGGLGARADALARTGAATPASPGLVDAGHLIGGTGPVSLTIALPGVDPGRPRRHAVVWARALGAARWSPIGCGTVDADGVAEMTVAGDRLPRGVHRLRAGTRA